MTAPGAIEELPESDREFLDEKGWRCSVENVGGFIHVIIHDFELPSAYTPVRCDLLVRLPAGYPNANPDMFWTKPDVQLIGGNWPMNANVWEEFSGSRWQRWSRHFPDGRWRAGIDGLDTFLASIRRELAAGR
jgi:hypothetical protein